MEGQDFWKNFIFPGADSVWHIVVPTIFSGKFESWQTIEKQIPSGRLEFQRESMTCPCCKTFLDNTEHIFAIRVLISKEITEQSIIFRPSFQNASVCFDCMKEVRPGVVKFPCNDETALLVLNTLMESSISIKPTLPNATHAEIWHHIQKEFESRQPKLWTDVGRLFSQCKTCKRPNPKNRCSGCHFARYCTQKCSAADWKRHKGECEFLKENSFFCYKLVFSI